MYVVPSSILGRIVRVTDEVVEYRKWINDTFPQHPSRYAHLTDNHTILPVGLVNIHGSQLVDRSAHIQFFLSDLSIKHRRAVHG